MIGFFGSLAHRVSEARLPHHATSLPFGITPGRIGTVFFSPTRSRALLEGRPANWFQFADHQAL